MSLGTQRKRHALGLCCDCGEAPVTDSRWRCDECQATSRLKQQAMRAQRHAAGVCVRCTEPTPNYTCDGCRDDMRDIRASGAR